MNRLTIHAARRIGALSASLTLAALLASCAEHFTTDPAQLHESLSLTNWSDTIVLGDGHRVVGHVTDDMGRAVLQRQVEWTATSVGQVAQLGRRAVIQRGPAPVSAVVARFATDSGATTFASAAGDSVNLVATHAGWSDVRLYTTNSFPGADTITRRVTVAVAGVRVMTVNDTTLTKVGEEMMIDASALGRTALPICGAVSGASSVQCAAQATGGFRLAPVPDQGLTWSRIGEGGAVAISGAGDALHVSAVQNGSDTLVVTHPICVAGAQCSDTVIVNVAIPADGPIPPPPGGDLVVFNDVNMWQNGIGTSTANQKFFENLVSFSSEGPRGTAKTVLFYTGASSRCAAGCSAPSGGYVGALVPKLVSLGYTIVNATGSLASIDTSVKLIFIWTPTVTIPAEDVNGLKEFARQGGRVVVVGENGGYMGVDGLAAENQLLADLGAQLTNQGGCDVSGNQGPAVVAGTSPLLDGVAHLDMACASPMTPGPRDYVLFRDPGNDHVVGAVVSIDLTPLPLPLTVRRQ